MLKIAVAAPAPMPSVMMAMAANDGERRSWRQANRRSPARPESRAVSWAPALHGRTSGGRDRGTGTMARDDSINALVAPAARVGFGASRRKRIEIDVFEVCRKLRDRVDR